jgi:hypothetical protein
MSSKGMANVGGGNGAPDSARSDVGAIARMAERMNARNRYIGVTLYEESG